ncbi:MAG: hypothetical protein ACLUKN_17600 [Bacilli bacterium]
MDEFFSSQKGRDLYFNRFKALFDRYGNDSAVFAWELWNEQNTVKADPKTVKSWQEYMFARIAGVCKKQLIVNSFGSFDSDWSKKSYKLFYSGTANAIAAIHRYLTKAQNIPYVKLPRICRRPMLCFRCPLYCLTGLYCLPRRGCSAKA